MNARLSSLLVAGGVVLAAIQPGSLLGASTGTDAPLPVSSLQGVTLDRAASTSAVLKLAIPGFSGTPKLQILSNPDRVVVDLPGVDRGHLMSRKELAAFDFPLLVKSRIAQFAIQPQPVTRVVMEVLSGTQVGVSCSPEGVAITLSPGLGEEVHARLEKNVPVSAAPPVMETEVVVARNAVAPTQEPAAQAPVVLAAPAPVLVAAAAPAPVLVAAAAPAPVLVAAAAPAPVLAAAPATPDPVLAAAPATPAPVLVAAAPVEAPRTAAPVVPAQPLPMLVKTAALAVPVVEAPRSLSPAAPAPALRTVASLDPVPSVGMPFRTLPNLPTIALLSAVPAKAPEGSPAPQSASQRESRTGRTLGDAQAHYTGTPMTIDLTNADLVTFLHLIADHAHLSLVCDSEVQGTFPSLKFIDKPWDQILDVILKNQDYGMEINNGIMRVARMDKFQKEEKDRRLLEEAKADSGDLVSRTRPLSFARATDAKKIVDRVLTKRGSIIIDERTNMLIISDLPRQMGLIEDLITQLDVPIQQVQIEARVVEANKNYERAIGVQWPTANSGSTNLQVLQPGSTTTTQNATWGSFGGPSWNSINNLPTANSNGYINGNAAAVAFSPGQAGVTDIANPAGQFWVSFLTNRMSVNFILQALESDGLVKIVSSPKVVTQNNKKAKVLSGQKIPYPAQQGGAAGGAVTVQFVDANLSLEVTPQITSDGTVIMDIAVEKAEADFSVTVQGTPTIDRRSLETQVLVKDGGTAILGGVYINQHTDQTVGVPFLSQLPLIGWMFRSKDNKDVNQELLIFITPHILRN
jgi:type IV pilus assembly protein PilQ